MTEQEMKQKIEELQTENNNLRCVMKAAYHEIKNAWEADAEVGNDETYKLLQYLHGKHRRVSHENNPYPQYVDSVEKSKKKYVLWASDFSLNEIMENKVHGN